MTRPSDQTAIADVATRILRTLEGLLEISGQRLHIKGRIGIALYPQDGEEVTSLLKNAHAALEQGQQQTANRPYAFYDAKTASKSTILLKLENLLYEALEHNQFYLTYQPQLNIKRNEITAMESLLRWRHPDIGEISPVKLIPLAEKTDLIVPIGNWILESACRQNKLWQQAGISPLPISVNLSLRQFQQLDLVANIRQILEKTGLEAQWLEIELTENTIMDDQDFSRSVLEELQLMGVKIALDGFGTGRGSFQCLQQFQLNSLKIDSSFIVKIDQNPEDLPLVSAMINLGHSFKSRVVAEGVETEAIVQLLQSLECEEVQGFWFCQPLKMDAATQFLRESSIQSYS